MTPAGQPSPGGVLAQAGQRTAATATVMTLARHPFPGNFPCQAGLRADSKAGYRSRSTACASAAGPRVRLGKALRTTAHRHQAGTLAATKNAPPPTAGAHVGESIAVRPGRR
jgi:hypothetical protein